MTRDQFRPHFHAYRYLIAAAAAVLALALPALPAGSAYTFGSLAEHEQLQIERVLNVLETTSVGLTVDTRDSLLDHGT